MKFAHIAAGSLMLLAMAGCSRLENVGQAPSFSPVGTPVDPIPAAITPQRKSLAQAAPEMHRRGRERASLWGSGPTALFGDRRASRLGDILTVVIEIDDEAQIRNSTARSRSGSENVAVPDLLGLPQLAGRLLPAGAGVDPLANLSSTSASAGDGSVNRNEEITLRLAATVIDVLPNGHLVVRGNQEVRVNYELRDLQVIGIVRPEDISRQNQITYDKMAEARIAYGGRGQISDVQQPRIGQQIADIILPF